MKKRLKIETISIDKITEYENNAKLHPQEQIDQIVKSMQEFGNNDPIAIDENNRIIEGHGRLLALKQMGETEVPIIRLSHLTDEQKRAYILVHNQLTLNTGFDEEILASELESIVGIDMEDFGFDLDILDLHEGPENVEEDVDFDPTPPEVPKTKPGDLYRLGEHYLLCGDATKAEDVARLMAAGTPTMAQCAIEDAPYNVAIQGGSDEKLTIQNDDMPEEEFKKFLKKAFANTLKYVEPGGAFYMWHASRTQREFEDALNACGVKVRQQLIWVKNTLTIGRQDFQWRHEPCFYGHVEGAPHKWYSDRKQTTVLEYDKPARNADHPTMKPLPLIAYQVQCSTKKGDTVIDFFGGSGSTLLASDMTGRLCRTMEIDPKYADVIVRRWEEMTGETAVLIGNADGAIEVDGKDDEQASA